MVEILDETNKFRWPELLERALEQLMAESGVADREVTVVLRDDAFIRERNRADRGIDQPTDVLSYPTHEPNDENFPIICHLGDIMISLDTARRQAEAAGHELLDEVLVLAAHGLTHLRGFDHRTEASWRTFRNAQQRILELARASR